MKKQVTYPSVVIDISSFIVIIFKHTTLFSPPTKITSSLMESKLFLEQHSTFSNTLIHLFPSLKSKILTELSFPAEPLLNNYVFLVK